ncbi:HAMP domain-containing histidine kinase [Salinispirillum sp. LH 10-3-1]|uniref:histidine kinase n=1 Tax=Salinispirillum sp. LH 10-3-1 TaxID=2952525 RepID=A0AB38YE11_9GAMM
MNRANLFMRLLHPASLRELVLIGFMLALIPLSVLLWQGRSALNELSIVAMTEAQTAVATIRRAEHLQNRITDIERAVRQYSVVRTDALAQLADAHIEQYLQSLSRACNALPETAGAAALCATHRVQLADLATNFTHHNNAQLEEQLQQVRRDQATLSTLIGNHLDQRIEQQQGRVAAQQQQLAIQTIVLVFLTLLLVVWVSGRVAAPVKRLDQMIRAMGQQQERPARDAVGGPRELNALGHRLHWLSGRLEQLEALRLVLLRHASHELKTPLASIQEGCSLLAEQLAGPLNDRQKEVVSLLSGSAERLNQLTEQLLDYNRLLQQARPELSWVNAANLIQQVLSEHALSIQQRQQTAEVDCQVEQLHTDPRLLTRILDNLINNAQAYGAAGGRIWLSLYQVNDELILDVANSGPAIPADQARLMFEPFQRGTLPRADALTGSGLGLSIVADCARLLQGHADIVQHREADVCVRITLPSFTTMDNDT